jgi:hypothetical protein
MRLTASRAPCRDCVRCVLGFANLLLNLALAILGQAFGLHLLVATTSPRAPHTQSRRTFKIAELASYSGQFDLTRLLAAALAIVFQNKRNLVTFVERPDARAFQRRGVHEHVLRTVGGRDETKTLSAIEELHGAADSHDEPFPSRERAGQMGPRKPRLLRFGLGH